MAAKISVAMSQRSSSVTVSSNNCVKMFMMVFYKSFPF
jgi:hypothetical protein